MYGEYILLEVTNTFRFQAMSLHNSYMYHVTHLTTPLCSIGPSPASKVIANKVQLSTIYQHFVQMNKHTMTHDLY